MNARSKVLTVRLLPIALAIAYFLLEGFQLSFPLLIASLFIGWVITIFGIEIGYHRMVAHDSFETIPIVRRVLVLLGGVAGVGSPVMWTNVHLSHHAFADTEQDPHSPNHSSALRVIFLGFGPRKMKRRFIAHVIKDPFCRNMHKYYFLGFLIGLLFVFMLSPVFCFYALLIPIEVSRFLQGYFNYIAHRSELKHGDRSRNIAFANWIYWGAAYHKNHHLKPSLSTTALHSGERDLCGEIIRCIQVSSSEFRKM